LYIPLISQALQALFLPPQKRLLNYINRFSMLIGLLGLIPVNQNQELAGSEAGIFFRVLNSPEANNYND
jgi:hypothetical protein